MTRVDEARSKSVRSLVPARLDRLPWVRFHWLIIVGLGVSWILDGLEIQIVSQAGYQKSLGLSSADVGTLGSVYLVGEVVGALFFGRITDRIGRRKIFILTLAIYLLGSGAAGFSWDLYSIAVFRFIAGVGIGGEYSAINSAIDELIPSHYRGRVDIAINGTYWGGAALGASANLYLLSDAVPTNLGWRLGFFIGPVIGLLVIGLRRHIPESPRWQMTHGHNDEAEKTVDEIERRVQDEGGKLSPVNDDKAIEIVARQWIPYLELAKIFLKKYPKRTALGFALMSSQAFLYNAIFFSYALVLQHFFGVSKAHTSYYFIPFALGNLAGPLLLGRLFDSIGRRANDLSDLHRLRHPPRHLGVPVPAGPPDRDDADSPLVHHLFLRLGRCVLGVPDRERDLPLGTTGPSDLVLLLDRADLRCHRHQPVRTPHRRGQQQSPTAQPTVVRVRVGCSGHDRRRCRGVLPGGRR